MLRKEEDIRDEAVRAAAHEVMLAIRTAPKTRGIDNLTVLVADADEKEQLAAMMDEIYEKSAGKRPGFTRDAKGVMAASTVILIGVKAAPFGLDCGYCGYPTCAEKSKHPGMCVFGPIDLGIGAGVAAARLADKCVDNRMMFSMGYAALRLGWFESGTIMALGFPLSVSGKSPYFDRNK